MLKIENKQISMTRGDTGTIKLKVKVKDGSYYEFTENDVIEFKVYPKKQYEEEPLIYKSIVVEENTNIIEIDLSSEDTRIGEVINKEKEYWYEIQYNHNITLIGYSDIEGPAIFLLLPEGREI